jgi:hypothetical protein
MAKSFKIGQRVSHDGHGKGTVTEVRTGPDGVTERYPGAYTPSRYPYVVRFDSGYTDVYAPSDLT